MIGDVARRAVRTLSADESPVLAEARYFDLRPAAAHADAGWRQDIRGRPLFYWGPGHAPAALEDCEYVDISPIAPTCSKSSSSRSSGCPCAARCTCWIAARLGQPIPHRRLRGSRPIDTPSLHRDPRCAPARPVQRTHRVGQHPHPRAHAHGVRVPLARSHDRHRHAVPRRALPTAAGTHTHHSMTHGNVSTVSNKGFLVEVSGLHPKHLAALSALLSGA